MKSVGEAMAIGRTFKESLQKALRSLEIDSYGFDDKGRGPRLTGAALDDKIRIPNARRIWYVADAYRQGYTTERLYELSKIDPWFSENIRAIVDSNRREPGAAVAAPRQGRWASPTCVSPAARPHGGEIRQARHGRRDPRRLQDRRHLRAEFVAHTPYLYSTYEDEDESGVTDRKKIIILGGGPESDRAGHRVRLLLRARRLRAEGSRATRRSW
jgi:carbamoyl-phosphate synthase large subunit